MKEYVKCKKQWSEKVGVTIGKIYTFPKFIDDKGITYNLNSDHSQWLKEFEFVTEEEYNKQNNINMKTNEQKLEELEKQIAALKEDIKKESEIKEGDYVVALLNSPGSFTKGNLYKVRTLSDSCRNIGVEYDDKGSTSNGFHKSNWRKATPDEVKKYEDSKKEEIYLLKCGYSIRITKQGIFDKENTPYRLDLLKSLLKPIITNMSSRDVYFKDFTLHFGCSSGVDVTLKEIKDIIEIAEKLQK